MFDSVFGLIINVFIFNAALSFKIIYRSIHRIRRGASHASSIVVGTGTMQLVVVTGTMQLVVGTGTMQLIVVAVPSGPQIE